MNLILFENDEVDRPLPRSDRRAAHILDVLRRQIGEEFDAGLINGARGKGTLMEITPRDLRLRFTWTTPPSSAPAKIMLIVGLPRPQTARDILRDATTLGCDAIHFVLLDKSEASYAQSTLWRSDEWRRHLIRGAEQAFDTRIPTVTRGGTLADTLAMLPEESIRGALDNYEAAQPLGSYPIASAAPVALAVGAERGWSGAERDLLRAHRFHFLHLGPRVLRTETAVIAALAIMRSRLGLV